ncbi:MAG: hypothetical protein ACK2UB_03295 [Anaerolineales bacterium]
MKLLFRGVILLSIPLLCNPLSVALLSPSTRTPSPSPTATRTLTPTLTPTLSPTRIENRLFADSFDVDGVLEETDRMEKSASPDWWVNSGGWFLQEDGIGSTSIGEAPPSSRWRQAYLLSNPWDTDQGAHPQNLFRLITRSTWSTPVQEVYFRIAADNLSASVNRNESNGVLLFSRYIDGDNLFYAGLRVDGYAVIKKKAGGAYTTLAESAWFPGAYDRAAFPNLIPHDTWIGLRTVVLAEADRLIIQLYIDPDRSGFWSLALQAEELCDPSHPLAGPGHAGIRTDFMDVVFDDYAIEEPLFLSADIDD